MSGYLVKRKGYSKVQGPYSVSRLKRYADEQRLWEEDLLSKNGETWKSAGSFDKLFPVSDYGKLTLSVEPEFYGEAFEESPTVSTLLEKIDMNEFADDYEDTAYDLKREPGFFTKNQIPYVVLSTYFVFGVSFGFALFIALQNIL